MAYIVGTKQETDNGAIGVTTIDSPNFTAVAGDLLVAYVCYSSGAQKTITLSDTVGSNDSWAEVEVFHSVGGGLNWGCVLRYCTPASAGSCTIRATFNLAVDIPVIVVVPVSGMEAGSPGPYDRSEMTAQTGPGGATDAVHSFALGTLSTQPQMIIGFSTEILRAVGAAVVGTGFTEIGSPAGFTRTEHKRVTSTASVDVTFTDSDGGGTNRFGTVGAAFIEGPEAEPPPRGRLRYVMD